MGRVRSGDLVAFETLVERHKNVVYSLAVSMLRSREDAEEAAQDTFLKLFRARETYDPLRPLEPWLLRIAGNACRDRLRRRRASQLPLIADGSGESMAQLVPDPASVGRSSREAMSQAIRHSLDQLSDKLRLPLVLKYLNGLTNQQISAALGISISNVKVRIARAKDVLQTRLERVIES